MKTLFNNNLVKCNDLIFMLFHKGFEQNCRLKKTWFEFKDLVAPFRAHLRTFTNVYSHK